MSSLLDIFWSEPVISDMSCFYDMFRDELHRSTQLCKCINNFGFGYWIQGNKIKDIFVKV